MHRIVKAFFIGFLVLFCSISAYAADPNFPSPTGHINDFADVLTASEKQQLETLSQSLKQQAGAELAVAIVKTVEPLDPKMYAVKLFEKWKIGQKGKDNGVLILLAMEERRIEIEVGYGLEGALPDAKVGAILDNYAVPSFKQGKFGEGLVRTSQAVSQVIQGEQVEGVNKPAAPAKENPVNAGILLLVLAVIVVLALVFKKAGSIPFAIMGAAWGYSEGALLGALLGAVAGFFFGFWGWRFMGRGGFGGGEGGFGGFGGGRSGGGGAGRGW